MGKRSYRASAAGVEKLNQAFNKYGKIQEFLACEVGCTRQTVNKFLSGKPISKELFIFLCYKLELDYQDIAELESEQNQNIRTFSSMDKVNVSYIPEIVATKTTLREETNNIQTCITSDTSNGQFSITIPGDINNLLHDPQKQKDLLKALRLLSGDENATIAKIEQGSIKITFNVSPDGIRRLEEEADKIILVARIISRNQSEKLDLSDTDLSGVDLSGVDLSGINFSCADLSNANLRDTNLENADLDCADLDCADLSGANLIGAKLRGTSFNDAIIDDKWLTVWKIVNQPYKDKNLRGADLRGADLIGANLIGANLIGANLIGADLIGADLIGANLIGANLIGADLIGANLIGADLIGADLRDADLIGADLSGADLSGANLIGADLRDANLSRADVKNARFGNNPGITEDAKRELEQRGAIFEDLPGDFVRSKIPAG